VNEPEGGPRWGLVTLMLWTPVVLFVLAIVAYVVGHWILRIW
jgi:hypothetical protein